MAGEPQITVVGNVTADPESRTVGNGNNVVNFTVASTPRTYNKQSGQYEDGEALFMRCSAWNGMADHIQASVTKGMRVIVQGRLEQRTFQDKQTGANRTSIELQVDEIGPSLRYATAQVQRVQRNQQQNSYPQGLDERAAAAPQYRNTNQYPQQNFNTGVPATGASAGGQGEFATAPF